MMAYSSSKHFPVLPGAEEEENEVTRKVSSKVVSETIDGFLLLEACGVEFPDDGLRADVSGYDATNVADFEYFPRLVSLDASENRLTPNHFAGLVKLKELKLSANGIEHVYAGGCLRNLVVLDLSYNNLRDLSQLPKVTPHLRELDLTFNQFSTFQTRFECLEKLNLDNNRLKDMRIINLPKLRDLRLAHNFIGSICGSFEHLESLCLAHNNLTKIDVSETTFPKLEFLSVYGNPLQVSDESEFVAKILQARRGWSDRKVDVAVKPPSSKCGAFAKSVTMATVSSPGSVVPPSSHFKQRRRHLLDIEHPSIEEEGSVSTPEEEEFSREEEEEGEEETMLSEDNDEHVAPLLAFGKQPAAFNTSHHARCSSLQALKFVLDHPLTTHDTRYPPNRGGPVPYAVRPTKASLNHLIRRRS